MRRFLTVTGLALFTLAASAACGPTSSSSSTSGDSKSPAACTHWSNIRGDVRAGILTDSELRSKVAEVRTSASDPSVRSAATDLLAAITSGNKTTLTSAYLALNKACS